jgi:hypothetical protein
MTLVYRGGELNSELIKDPFVSKRTLPFVLQVKPEEVLGIGLEYFIS